MTRNSIVPEATPDQEPPEAVAHALVEAFVTARKVVLPAGFRVPVIRLLTRAVVNAEFRDLYCRAVTAERLRSDVDRVLDQSAGSGDIPELEIARHGFSGLTDEQLADYAIDPDAIVAIAGRLNDGDDLLEHLGRWFVRAGKGEVSARPEEVERTKKLLLAKHGESAHERDRTEVERPGSSAVVPTLPPRHASRWVRFAVPVALAASLLLAFYLGTFWPRNDGRREVRLASVAVRGDVTRGIEDVALDVTNGTDRRVFLTVVGLAPGRKTPAYHYRSEGRYVEVPAGGTAAVKNLPPEFEGSTVLLVVSTHGPAGGVVREVMPSAAAPGSAAADAEQLRKALADIDIAADVRVVALPAKR